MNYKLVKKWSIIAVSIALMLVLTSMALVALGSALNVEFSNNFVLVNKLSDFGLGFFAKELGGGGGVPT
ncbi:MAG: hypothetical protein E4G98_04835 [Promethearchaeota archaeon]|nr:MAG: hypothetical protein E4G98_04835 [Candidatus Lokiarchaeota archaeon]